MVAHSSFVLYTTFHKRAESRRLGSHIITPGRKASGEGPGETMLILLTSLSCVGGEGRGLKRQTTCRMCARLISSCALANAIEKGIIPHRPLGKAAQTIVFL